MIQAEAAAVQAELLENVIATAQRLIKAEKDKAKITPSFIAEKVKRAADMFAAESQFPVNQQQAVTLLIQRFSHWMGKATTLKDDSGHVHWLNANRKRDWLYWRRYRDFQEGKLSDVVVDALDDATNNILELLEDPLRTGAWDRRGLIVGHVQSGKTSNYSGLICKAADAGYKIIIVLAGMHNNLRSQTQIRLEEAFLGYETTDDRGAGKPIGVGHFGDYLKTNSATTRADNGDFSKVVAKHFHGISPEERPWLFVVKKQKTVLTALLNWLQTRVADATDFDDGRQLITKLPLLMIDDEADNASVDTGEQLFNEDGTPNEEHQPKTINSLIRQVLHTFTRKVYVGYTATPFANIFIHHKGATAKEGPDLFPRSFIINLAAPSNYIGPARLFGRMSDEGRVGALPLTRDIVDNYDPQTESGWMPPKHNKNHTPTYNGQETIPTSLRDAVYSFALACAARELRGLGSQHCSMLIHTTRFVSVQNLVREQVEETVRRMRQRITRGIDATELLTRLQQLWENDFIPTRDSVAMLSPPHERPPEMPCWDEICGALPLVMDDIEVRSINGSAKDALDYAAPGAALKVIAVGGDKLARGLTLEGLCTSYFIRTTRMYDTLMQMGRWFGYRPGYLDLCRLYTSPDLVSWFGHIADASEELREEFDFMAAAHLTPEQYGLKVKSHEVLTITSPLKMRNSQTLSLTYSGTRPQTILFHRDPKIQEDNLAAADALISCMGAPSVVGPEYARDGKADKWKNSRLWKDVDAVKILSFLGSYATHPNATSAKSPLLADFITKMVEIGQLKQWSVALLAEGDGVGDPYVFSKGISVEKFPMRTPDAPKNPDHGDDPTKFAIGVLTDPSDEGLDLDDEAWRKALALTRAAWNPDPARGRDTPPSIPSGKGIRMAREQLGGAADRGLLLLYPLSPYAGKRKLPDKLIVPSWDKPIMAFAIAFPASDSAIRVEYEVNLLYWMQEYGPSE
jgi:Z1 domain